MISFSVGIIVCGGGGVDRRAGFRFSNFQNMLPEITCLILARKFKVGLTFFKIMLFKMELCCSNRYY